MSFRATLAAVLVALACLPTAHAASTLQPGELGGAMWNNGFLSYRFTRFERLTMPVLVLAGETEHRPERAPMSWPALLLFYLLMSVVCFAAYALDKSAARRGERRIPERRLLLLGLLGGWPGALLAQQWLRHKTRKQPFRTLFWCSVAVNLALFSALVACGPAVGNIYTSFLQ